MRTLVLGLGCAALCAPGSAHAQVAVRSVHMVADLTGGDGGARVRVEYVLAPDTAREVGATALELAGARMENVHLERDGAPLAIGRPRPLAGVVRLPVTAGPDPTARGVVAAYAVTGAVRADGPRVRAHVPVLSVDLPPEAASPGLFRAEVRVPPGWRVAEGFPTGLRATDTPGVYAVELAVVPAVVSFRARSDGRWRPGLPAVLDALAVLVIVGSSVIGWRHLRDTA